jgi:glycerophosphoryl diester phosphodiesterase
MMSRTSTHCLSVVLTLGVLFAATVCQAAEIVAHRGASHDAPENTLASVNLGWEVAGIEQTRTPVFP